MLVGITVLLVLVPSTLQFQCPKGQYKTASNICKKCSPQCDGGRKMVQQCTSDHDIICECPAGKFWENALLYCKRCTSCPKGNIAALNCTHAHDRRCVNCNPGTYAATPTTCLPCKHCGIGQVTKFPCNSSHNTICGDNLVTKNVATSKPTVWTISFKTPTPIIIYKREPINILLVVVAFVLAFVVCAFFVLAYYRCEKHKRGSAKLGHKRPSIDTCSSEQDTFIDKEIAVPVIAHDPGYLMRSVSADIIYSLARLLNPDGLNNWVKVASELHFTQIDINNFAINKDRAFQMLMEVWMTQRNSTVYRLYKIFLNMARDDCATILENVLLSESV